MKIKDIPEYVLNPSYKMTHIMVAEVENGLFQYRRCFTTKSGATRRFNTVTKQYPNTHFEIVAVKDIVVIKDILKQYV